MKLSKTLLSVLIGMTMAAPSYSSFLSEQTDKMFNETLSNVTTPGAYETRQRGVLTGGQYTAHNRIRNVQLFSFSLPSISAGCGGIDIFAGSFSFINSDQLVALMRSIASNAVSYAFKVALETMSPTISGIITELNDLAQKINSSNINSCRIAQGFVNDIANKFVQEGTIKNQESLYSTVTGVWDDFSAIFNHPQSSSVEDLPDDAKKQIYGNGNIMYHALKDSSALTAFGSKGNREDIEQILSVTGMVIVTAKNDTSETATDGNSVDFKTEPPLFSFEKIMNTKKKEKSSFYVCKNDDCSEFEITQKDDFEGISSKFIDLLIGSDHKAGEETYVGMLATNSENVKVDNKVKQLFEHESQIQRSLVLLAREGMDKDILINFVKDNAAVISYSCTLQMLDDLFDTVIYSVENSKLGNKSTTIKQLKEWRKKYENEALRYATQNNIKNKDMVQSATDLIESKQKGESGKQLNNTTNK